MCGVKKAADVRSRKAPHNIMSPEMEGLKMSISESVDWIHLSIFISFPSTHFYPDQTVMVDWALKMKESVH